MRQVLVERQISKHHRAGLELVRRKGWTRPAKINLGCGRHPREGYLNVDMFPGGDLTLDIRRPLPFESNCCEEILSEHCIEHLDYPDTVTNVLKECCRVLKPGGAMRFSVPDTEWPLKDYVKGPDAEYFRACREHGWGHPAYCTTRMEHINFHFRQGEEHRFAYDEESAVKLMRSAGFEEVRRVPFDPRIDSAHREIGSLFVSGRKPA